MLLRLLKAERLKLKRSPVWLAFLLMPIVPALLGTLNYIGNIDILKSEWYSLWTQHTLFTCYFFLPVMVGIYCAYLMRLEHDQHNWNKMLTMPVQRPLIFLAKLITASVMILLSELWIGILFVLSGKLIGMTAAVPLRSVAIWCLFGTLGGTVMAAIQLLISLSIKSFTLPIGISLAGGISGLIFLAKNLGHIWLYSLMAYGMNSNAPQQMLKSGYAGFVIICVVYILIITSFASALMNRREL
ncbi:MAG: ABC transporter permease [Lachnospiraceae bacterium]|nr:ABC transporter permease [Lachnospiraceae bacterium]